MLKNRPGGRYIAEPETQYPSLGPRRPK